MESNVKFVQIVLTMGNDFLSPAIYALDTDGQLWRRLFGDDWVKSEMPMDWQKAFDDELKFNNDHHWSREVLRNAHPAYLKRIHDSCVSLAHCAFMLHPELREE